MGHTMIKNEVDGGCFPPPTFRNNWPLHPSQTTAPKLNTLIPPTHPPRDLHAELHPRPKHSTPALQTAKARICGDTGREREAWRVKARSSTARMGSGHGYFSLSDDDDGDEDNGEVAAAVDRPGPVMGSIRTGEYEDARET